MPAPTPGKFTVFYCNNCFAAYPPNSLWCGNCGRKGDESTILDERTMQFNRAQLKQPPTSTPDPVVLATAQTAASTATKVVTLPLTVWILIAVLAGIAVLGFIGLVILYFVLFH